MYSNEGTIKHNKSPKSKVPGIMPNNCKNSQMMAIPGNANAQSNFLSSTSASVAKMYEAIHNPLGKQYFTKYGKFVSVDASLTLSTTSPRWRALNHENIARDSVRNAT